MSSEGPRLSGGGLSPVLFLVAALLVIKTQSEVYRSLQWTPENSIFRLNSSRCVDGVLRMNVLPSSKIHVICPTSVTVLDTVQSPKPKHELYENLWIVYDKESFEKCDASVTTGKPSWQASRLLMQCDTPLELKYFTLVFQEFSAVGGGLAFPPGKEYYFFATSNGDKEALEATSGGNCNNTEKGVSMKFKVYVCNDTNDVFCAQSNVKPGSLYCERRQPWTSALKATPTLAPSSTKLSQSTKTSSRVGPSTPSTEKTTDALPVTSVVPTNDSISVLGPDVGDVVPRDSRSPSRDSRDAWMAVAISLLCLCVLLIVGLCINRKCSKENRIQIKGDPDKKVPLVML